MKRCSFVVADDAPLTINQILRLIQREGVEVHSISVERVCDACGGQRQLLHTDDGVLGMKPCPMC